MQKLAIKDSEYQIKKGKILRTKKMTEIEKYFEISLEGGRALIMSRGSLL